MIWAYDLAMAQAPEHTALNEIVGMAKRVVSLKPAALPLSRAVFAVLRKAKASNKWDTVREWVDLLMPESLSDEPMMFGDRQGWSQQALWYNYKIVSELEAGSYDSAERLGRLAAERFPKQDMFFYRLQAKALCSLGQLREGLEIYERLCRNPKTGWWLRYEFARYLKENGQIKTAMAEMSQAALAVPQPSSMVNLLFDLGNIFAELGDKEIAAAHFVLAEELRRQEGWSIPRELSVQLESLTVHTVDALTVCRKAWHANAISPQERERVFFGKVTGLFPNRAFCFIKADEGEDIFTPVSLLASGVASGSRVRCKAIRAYDKKKNKDGWQAVHVQIASS
jgi:tetratricopeptide (TPR) repeat protein